MTDIYSYVKYGEPPLDFVNSKVWNTKVQPFADLFIEYEHVVRWFRHMNILNDAEVELLLDLSKSNPTGTQKALKKIITLRDANYRSLTAITHNELPNPDDIEILNQYLSEAMQHRVLCATDEGILWTWANRNETLDWMLWPVALETAELLISESANRIRECSGCYWLFMDTSRNGQRRWCDMKTCGNRAKAHRHYEKTKISKN